VSGVLKAQYVLGIGILIPIFNMFSLIYLLPTMHARRRYT